MCRLPVPRLHFVDDSVALADHRIDPPCKGRLIVDASSLSIFSDLYRIRFLQILEWDPIMRLILPLHVQFPPFCGLLATTLVAGRLYPSIVLCNGSITLLMIRNLLHEEMLSAFRVDLR